MKIIQSLFKVLSCIPLLRKFMEMNTCFKTHVQDVISVILKSLHFDNFLLLLCLFKCEILEHISNHILELIYCLQYMKFQGHRHWIATPFRTRVRQYLDDSINYPIIIGSGLKFSQQQNLRHLSRFTQEYLPFLHQDFHSLVYLKFRC